MIEFEPEKSWLAVEARMEQESDARVRANLAVVRDHMRAEIRGEHAALMETLTDEPRYHMWGLPTESGPKGRANVSAFYEQMIATGGHRFHFDVRRVCADRDTVVTEGAMRSLVPAAALAAAGVEAVDGEPVADDVEYVTEWPILTVWPIDADGKIVGEDIYFAGPPMQRIARRAR